MSRVDCTIHLLSPMAHGTMGGDTGNAALVRRFQILHNGEIHRVPGVSAGALRGVVRRLLWREVFDACGLSADIVPDWDRLYAALCNGGTIESAESRVDPATIRERRRALPVLSLLGAALYSSYMAGQARVSNALLDCSEIGTGARSCWDLITEETRVRHVDREEQDTEVSGVTPMPTTVEAIMQGATLRAHAHITGPLERSAWAHGLDLVTHLGGKAGQGFGEVRIEHTGDGAEYVAWMDEHRDAVSGALLDLATQLARGGK